MKPYLAAIAGQMASTLVHLVRHILAVVVAVRSRIGSVLTLSADNLLGTGLERLAVEIEIAVAEGLGAPGRTVDKTLYKVGDDEESVRYLLCE